MIYWMLFYQFLLIGLLAVGGGAATIPFLFDLSAKYDWFSIKELTDMIAVSESTPGPMGVNMAVYAGYKTAGVSGAVSAVFGLVLPSVVIIIVINKLFERLACEQFLHDVLKFVQPAVVALILSATLEIAKISLLNTQSWVILVFMLVLMRFYKAGPIFYISASGILGYTFGL